MWSFAVMSVLALAEGGSAAQIIDYKVDQMVAPITVQSASPSFSWGVDAGQERGYTSKGYQIDVTKVAADGTAEASPLWSTGMVDSNATTFIRYTGPALTSDTDYVVALKTAEGLAATTTFSTALYSMKDWAAGSSWVQAAVGMDAAQVRKTFAVPAGTITRARAYFAMPGYGTLAINGKKVDGTAGTRTWSQYDKRTIYGVYDVTDVLNAGATNAIGVYAGAGWYGMWGYGPPAFRLMLSVTVAGKTMTMGSDGSWVHTQGPIMMNSEYNGETYDARLETPGWTTAAFKQDPKVTWAPITLAAGQKGFHLNNATLDSMSFPAIDVIHEFTAKWWKEPSPNVYVYDFEQNMGGWVRLKIPFCEAGQTIQFRHAELLQHPPYGPIDGNIYVGNLRSAKATDRYTCKGDPNGEEWQPTFTQHGFRYVEVTGLTSPPSMEMLTAINVRSALEQTGTISFSDDMLNKVQHNILWGQQTNLMMIPTDCDQRDERLGWTGDSALASEEALSQFDMGAFYHNWAKMIDESSPNGAVADTIPTKAGGGNGEASTSADASWASVYPSVIWGMLKYTGDTSVGQFWFGLQRFMDNEWTHLGSPADITKIFAQFGDWVPPPSGQGFKADGKVSTKYSAGFSFVNDLVHMVEVAQHVGTATEVTKWSGIFAQAKALFHKQWYSETNKYYENGSQTAQVLALTVPGLVPEADKAAVVAHLVNDIVHVHGNHTTCGIIGWRWELDVLAANGFGDVAYALITQQTYPSYGYEILNPVEPATTIWELWNSDVSGPGMNSRDHIMFGGPGKWIYNYVGGISQADDSIGFEHIVLTPPATLIEQGFANPTGVFGANATISKPLKFTTASFKTLRGVIEMAWSLPQGGSSSTCGSANEGENIKLACPGSTVASVAFADYGTATGTCNTGFAKGKCNTNSTLVAFVGQCCVGKAACAVKCDAVTCECSTSGTLFAVGDPCYGTAKKLNVAVTCTAKPPHPAGPTLNMDLTIPAGSDSQLVVPLLGSPASDVTIAENGTAVFKGGAYVPGAPGVTGAVAKGSTVVVSHGSGSYSFVRSG